MGVPHRRGRRARPGPPRSCPARRPGVPEAGSAPGGALVLSPPRDDLDLDLEPPRSRVRHARPKHWSRARVHRRRRRVLAAIAAVFSIFVIWFAFSFGSAVTHPALGSDFGARAAEWFRGHGGASIVVW